MTSLNGVSPVQYERLMRPLNGNRVKKRDGNSYLEAWDVRAHLIRTFGFGGFSVTADEAEMVSHREVLQRKKKADDPDKFNHEVCWKVRVTLVIPSLQAVYSEYAVGSNSQPSLPDAHDTAIKSAESDGLKRCAINLGTQFGLSLYNDGSLRDVIVGTLVGPWQQPFELEERPVPDGIVDAGLGAPADGEAASHTVSDESEGFLDAAMLVEQLREAALEQDNGKRIILVAGLKEKAKQAGVLDVVGPRNMTIARLADLVATGQFTEGEES
jgi:hypothetical protein